MRRSTDQFTQGVGMIVRTTAPEHDSGVWADYSPHRVRTTSAPETRTVIVAPKPTSVSEPQPSEPIVVAPVDAAEPVTD